MKEVHNDEANQPRLYKLRLICGNIARTLNPALFRRRVSGMVERWVRVNPFIVETIPFIILAGAMLVFVYHQHLNDRDICKLNQRLQEIEKILKKQHKLESGVLK